MIFIVLIGILSLIFAALSNVALIGHYVFLKDRYLFNFSFWLHGLVVAIMMSFFSLITLFVNDVFQVKYVALHSNTKLPMVYKICALWGGHEGSFLLWLTLLSLWTIGVWYHMKNLMPKYKMRVVIILTFINLTFCLFIILTSNPFLMLVRVPVEGIDLNPLLQDPGMIAHPPILYMGYVGFAITYAAVIAGMFDKSKEATWIQYARQWHLLGWVMMTIGIVLGSHWAYRELGWGGWWFWDPVENASFMPWLIGTALLHSMMVLKTDVRFLNWVAILAIFGFSLSLLGTFLVRSGILISVHSFAADPLRGVYLLMFFAFTIMGSLSLLFFAKRSTYVSSNQFQYSDFFIINNVLFIAAMLIVLLGTIYPLIHWVIFSKVISVGPPYFNKVLAPIVFLMMLFMSLAMQTDYKKISINFKTHIKYIGVACTLAIIIVYAWVSEIRIVPVFLLLFPFWLLLSHWAYFTGYKKMKLPLLVAHFGLVISTFGIVMDTQFSSEKLISFKLNETVMTNNDLKIKWDFALPIKAPNYTGFKAWFSLARDNHRVGHIIPEYRIYFANKTVLPHAGIMQMWWGDYHLNIGQKLDDGSWMIRFQEKPFVRFIWYGGIMMAIGGLLALLRRKES